MLHYVHTEVRVPPGTDPALLLGLPLFPSMDSTVTALGRHPSAIHQR